MKLQLNRPITFFDLETTGITITTDKIIDIALIKIHVNGELEKKYLRLNPGMPIPKVSSDIHGILDEDVVGKPSFKDVAKELADFFEGSDLGGYNSNRFDIPLISEEFARVGIDIQLKDKKMVDVQQIFMKMEKRTLEAAYKFYCNKELINSHSAQADIEATVEVLMGQMDKYPDLPTDVDRLHDLGKGDDFADFSRRIKIVNGVKVFNFGKHKEQSVLQLFKREPQYYAWMMKGDFAQDTKAVITEIYNESKR